MPEFCSCGAQLPPDARFCHKCGKPQRDEPVFEPPPPAIPEISAPPVPAPVPLSFRNPIAIRVGFLTAALLCLLMVIPGVNYASILWLLGGGYFSVWIYKRRTGQRLSVRGGARMGWITGVISFALLALLFTLSLAAIQRAGGFSVIQDRLKDFAVQQSSIEEAAKLLQSPVEILKSLLVLFVVMTLTCTAGGALGAKMLSKD
ncbi:MAG TPA: zinc ribbon domain-containing protein [Bryobacteraceae bacterium]|nr:zinc ribbon domain-containing protein [Bryobacteraceae bacterium]